MATGRSTVSRRRLTMLGVAVAVVTAVTLIGLDARGWLSVGGSAVADDGTEPIPGDQVAAAADAVTPDAPRQEPAGAEGGRDGDGDVPAVRDDAAARDGTDEAPDDAAPAPTSAEEEIEGQQVAADFAVAFATYHYADPPDALSTRVAPYATQELLTALAAPGGAGAAARAELAARQEVATARVEAVQPQASGDGRMDLLVVVRQDVVTVDGATTAYQSYLTRVERTADGWRVSGFQP